MIKKPPVRLNVITTGPVSNSLSLKIELFSSFLRLFYSVLAVSPDGCHPNVSQLSWIIWRPHFSRMTISCSISTTSSPHRFCSTVILIIAYCFILSTDFSTNNKPMVSAIRATSICSKIPGFTPKQRKMCQTRPDAIVAVGDGAKLALKECQQQFYKHRWNCSSIGTTYLFGQQDTVGSKEAAYITAVNAAGVTYKVTASCSRGSMSRCSCDPKKDLSLHNNYIYSDSGSWKWGGCSDHIKYGMRFSSSFLDDKEKHRKYHRERTLMNLHNNRAGRKAVKSTMLTKCKCHGVSGSCSIKSCWKILPSFKKIGTYLKYRYYQAKQVEVLHGYHWKGRRKMPLYLKLRQELYPVKKPRRKDLVFLESSPNYCVQNKPEGSFGTEGRACSLDSDGQDHCNVLCCGRGYNTRQYTKDWQCNCKFHWCCHVTCDKCVKRVVEYSCK